MDLCLCDGGARAGRVGFGGDGIVPWIPRLSENPAIFDVSFAQIGPFQKTII